MPTTTFAFKLTNRCVKPECASGVRVLSETIVDVIAKFEDAALAKQIKTIISTLLIFIV